MNIFFSFAFWSSAKNLGAQTQNVRLAQTAKLKKIQNLTVLLSINCKRLFSITWAIHLHSTSGTYGKLIQLNELNVALSLVFPCFYHRRPLNCAYFIISHVYFVIS